MPSGIKTRSVMPNFVLKPRLLGVVLLTSGLLAPLAVRADAAAGLSPEMTILLEKAAGRNDGSNMATATVLAIDANPKAGADILAKAISLSPQKEGEIRKAVEAAFPDRADLKPAVESADSAAGAKKPSPRWGFLSTSGWGGSAELSASRNTGNTDEASLGFIADLSKTQGQWKHHFGALADFQQSEGETTKQRFLGRYQLDYNFDGPVYSFGSVQYENDRFGGFDYRIVENAGLGYIVVSSDRFQWTLEGGPGARHTKPDWGGKVETEFVGLGKSKFAWVISKSSILEHDFQIYVGSTRTTIDTTAALKMKIYGHLSGRLSYNVRYSSDVTPETRKIDTITRAGIVYDF